MRLCDSDQIQSEVQVARADSNGDTIASLRTSSPEQGTQRARSGIPLPEIDVRAIGRTTQT